MLAPAEFDRHVRNVFASLATPCPLDGTAENLLQLFTCGRHELVVRDIRAVLPADAAERALDLIARRLEREFDAGLTAAFVREAASDRRGRATDTV